jgi:phosphate-selective porin OprO and OprP
MLKIVKLFFLSLFLSPSFALGNQSPIPELGLGDKGLVIKHDPSNFEMAIRFRTQFRYTFEDYDSSNTSKSDYSDFNVRRMRLRFDGTACDKRFLYKIQLSFTRGDMDFETVAYPNILRDAAIGWKLTDKSIFWFGQTKLPGNRQRVVSSGSQELVDRSLLNATFNIDRDMGVQWYNQFGDEAPFWLKLAISNGEGRSRNNQNKDMSYTARAEWLPLGKFKEGGDYFEGDLLYEKKPKVSMGLVYNTNPGTNRTGGQTGEIISDGTDNLVTRNIQTIFADFLLKYRGFALSTEYAKRMAKNPIVPVSATENSAIYKGQAVSAQISYNFANHISPILRYTKLFPDSEILSEKNAKTQYTVGLTKYINKHQIKVMGDLTLEQERNTSSNLSRDNMMMRMQLEFGI